MKALESKKWERRSEARPGEIIAAALKIFAHKGFAATRLEDVAAAAGVSKATVYLYFDNKEQLFASVVREGVAPIFEHTQALVHSFEGSTPALVRKLFGVVDKALDTPFPALAKLVIGESGNFPALAKMWGEHVIVRMMALIRRVIHRGIDRGEFRAVVVDDVVPLWMAPVLMIAIWEQSIGRHVDVRFERRAILDAHVESILRNLAVPQRPQTERKIKP
jgi:AcrR family transcriptional regulator